MNSNSRHRALWIRDSSPENLCYSNDQIVPCRMNRRLSLKSGSIHWIVMALLVLAVVFSLLPELATAKDKNQDQHHLNGLLFIAVDAGDLARAKKLVSEGAEVDPKRRPGSLAPTPIMLSIQHGPDMVRLLLDKGAVDM
jgi:ankyrin repeat protein